VQIQLQRTYQNGVALFSVMAPASWKFPRFDPLASFNTSLFRRISTCPEVLPGSRQIKTAGGGRDQVLIFGAGLSP
jgi:hypothetical protein